MLLVEWEDILMEVETPGVRIISVELVDQVHLEVLVLLEHSCHILHRQILFDLEVDSYWIMKGCLVS